MKPALVIAAASHSPAILNANLARSPLIASGAVALHVEADAPSASIAYNRALDATDAPLIVFAHHDVFLPLGWEEVLADRIAEVAALDPDWALIGAYGIGEDYRAVGPVWSSSLGGFAGRVPLAPVKVQSFDELLIVLRRDAGLRFDEGLPGWHLYGTDIVQTARAAGRAAYAPGLPCIHNDRYHGALGPDYSACYRYMQRKWAAVLPIQTPVSKVTRSGLHLIRQNWRDRRATPILQQMAVGTDTLPEVFAARCGWSDLRSSD